MNIVVIIADTLRARHLGCYGNTEVRTPSIDTLAATGVRFESAYIGTWCMPSRATLLTGHHQFGVESMRMVGDYPGSDYDPRKCRFWPSVFLRQGYVTAHIGKLAARN